MENCISGLHIKKDHYLQIIRCTLHRCSRMRLRLLDESRWTRDQIAIEQMLAPGGRTWLKELHCISRFACCNSGPDFCFHNDIELASSPAGIDLGRCR